MKILVMEYLDVYCVGFLKKVPLLSLISIIPLSASNRKGGKLKICIFQYLLIYRVWELFFADTRWEYLVIHFGEDIIICSLPQYIFANLGFCF